MSKRPRREDKPFKETAKIAGRVFDDKTIQVILSLMHKQVFDGVDFPISGGKEAIVFRCRAGKGFVATKIFKYETTSFRKMQDYIIGDPRFRLKHSLAASSASVSMRFAYFNADIGKTRKGKTRKGNAKLRKRSQTSSLR